jgi:ABC-type transport system substrate-binding protein
VRPHLPDNEVPRASEKPLSRRELMRWGSIAGAGLVFGGPILAGCMHGNTAGSTGGSPPAKPTGTLHVANNAEPSTLDPTLAATYVEYGILGAIYEPLLRYKPGTVELEGVLVENGPSTSSATSNSTMVKP